MKGSGYDQFFKAAKGQTKATPSSPRPAAKVRPKPPPSEKTKARVKKSGFNWGGLLASVLVSGLALGGIFYLEEFDSLASRVDISLFGQANAAEETPQTKAEKAAKPAVHKEAETKAEEPAKAVTDPEDLSYLGKLRERKQELDHREAALAELEKELQEQKKALDEKIVELKKIRSEIASVLKERIDYDNERIGKLVEFYSNMKPQQAAKVFEDIDEDLAVEVLGRMQKKNAANIMNLLKPDKAQALSEKFAGYQPPGK